METISPATDFIIVELKSTSSFENLIISFNIQSHQLEAALFVKKAEKITRSGRCIIISVKMDQKQRRAIDL